ncbi:MAG: ATP phosphoribosyltransferase [Pseudomonadota bacterium]
MTVTLALPSKGRLREKAMQLLIDAGYEIQEPADKRSYRATVTGEKDLEVAFLSASEIARELALGNVDAGITGEDLVRENVPDSEAKLEMAVKLGFGGADVVVAVPEAWYDVATMADLGEVAASFRARYGRRLRIATKYFELTQKHFSERHGIQLYRIIESFGATEGAPATGQADIIVDITSSGETLRANHLKVLDDGVILKSQACLFMRSNEDDQTIARLREALTKLVRF